MIRRFFFVLTASIILTGCGNSEQKTATVTDTPTNTTPVPSAADSLAEYSEYATYYMAIADTGTNYYKLDEKMYKLSTALNFPIDTMGRYYDRKKDNIVLNEKDEDEMYRGEYFPRRSVGEHLSLDYLYFFDTTADSKTIVLLAGIYENAGSADSMVRILRKHTAGAYTLKGSVFVGCMH